MDIVDTKEAFNKAIENKDLSESKDSTLYVGKYMYMFSDNQVHSFKNRMTREYLTTKV
jgi:hypothetical protein